MIHKLFTKVFRNKKADVNATAPLILPISEHQIKREQISPGARKIISALQEKGFSAFVVGGAIRDLLLGIQPKDFDVATDATPEQIQALFRRAFIIGRRFRLVHVIMGNETVEVSTFRSSQPTEVDGDKLADEHGRIVRDNVFGKQEEDAERRDFTVNSLFYNPTTEEILDYLNGFHDIRTKQLRIIGDPHQRYREDPVRMLRAIRLSAKLGLTIDHATLTPIISLAPLLQNVPASRLFDEMLKLLLSGYAAESIQELRRHGLHHGLLPLLDVILEQPLGERFVSLALRNTDQRIKSGKTVSPSFMFAALLWHEVLAAWQELQKNGSKRIPALIQAMDRVIEVQAEKIAIPRRYGTAMKEIWALQPRFENRSGRRPLRLLKHPRFRAGFDFLLLRCESGELKLELGDWWEKFQVVTPNERNVMLAEFSPKKQTKKPLSPDTTDIEDDEAELDFDESAH